MTAGTVTLPLVGGVPVGNAAGWIGLARVGIGVVGLLAARRAVRPLLRAPQPSAETVTFVRMAAGRDLALGLGTVLAARHGSPGLRGWLEAGALADLADVYAYLADCGHRGGFRVGAVLAAAGGAGTSLWLVSRLRRP